MEAYWRKQAKALSLRMNLARWLEAAVPASAGLAVALGCATLLFRLYGLALEPIGWGAVAGVVILTAVAIWRMRRHWFDETAGLVRLEATLRLHNRLSSAAAGVGQWPEPQPVSSGARWHWPRLLGPLLVGGSFFALALWVPITSTKAGAASGPSVEPLAWSRIEAALEEIKPLTTPEATEELRQQLEGLRQRSKAEWYSQGSLEAGDALKVETKHAIARLEHHLGAAIDLLANGEATAATESLWKEAVRGMQSNPLPLNAEALAGMPLSFQNLSAQEREALAQQLASQQGTARQGLQQLGESLEALESSITQGEGMKEPGGRPGRGGAGAPLGFENDPKQFAVDGQLPISTHDPSRMALGDSVKTILDEHETPKDLAPTTGGSVSTVGTGGEAVWKNELPPKEQAVLRRFFD